MYYMILASHAVRGLKITLFFIELNLLLKKLTMRIEITTKINSGDS